MKRITRFLVTSFLSIAVWLAVQYEVVDRFVPVDPRVKAVNAALPAWTVIAVGSYALYCIGMGLYHFGDPGSAAEDLNKDIAEAKAGLRRKGFKSA